jgi:hypothetical protein
VFKTNKDKAKFFILVVGSAAYNLLVISALCIMAIEGTETRRIKLYTVFMVNYILLKVYKIMKTK